MLLKTNLLPLLALAVLVHLGCADSGFSTGDYSSEPVTQVAASTGLNSRPARSVIECAGMCTSAGGACMAFAFTAATGACVASSVRTADLSTAAPGAVVFRNIYIRNVIVQVGDRTFRVIQQRSKGILSFARNWTDYENGFGDDTDFWLGLKSIYDLTSSTPRVFRMEAVTWAGLFYVSEFSGFSIGSASTFYTMTFNAYLTGSSNTTSDSLTYHKGAKFSTVDKDNGGYNCSVVREGRGGWWYVNCAYSNPSGIYLTSAVANDEHNMFWGGANGNNALKSIRLMLQIA